MCYRYRASVNQDKLREEFQAKYEDVNVELERTLFGFDFPQGPVILDASPRVVTMAEWGLMPVWAKDHALQKNTLNCMIETAAEKPSFKASVGKRCLVLASEFYEYKWEQPGNAKCKKHLYAISIPGRRAFAMAGIYSEWRGELTYTILTTAANTLMAEIHNNKKRMPVVLHKDEHALWLNGDPLDAFADRSELELSAVPVDGGAEAPPVQGSLF